MHHLCFRDDPDLDRMMKDRPRWGDPMAHLVKVVSSDLFSLYDQFTLVQKMFCFMLLKVDSWLHIFRDLEKS